MQTRQSPKLCSRIAGFLALSLAASVSGTALAAPGDVTVVLPEQPANLEPCRSIRNDIAPVRTRLGDLGGCVSADRASVRRALG